MNYANEEKSTNTIYIYTALLFPNRYRPNRVPIFKT